MEDYTAVFNKVRITKGLAPVTRTIGLIREGTILKCGCAVHASSLSFFSVYHGPDCKSTIRPKPDKWLVGIPMAGATGQAVGTLEDDVIGVTNPWLGLFPYEQARAR